MIRNENVRTGSLVAVGTDEAIPSAAQGRMGLVQNISYPKREGRGRRNYQAQVLFADGATIQVDVKFLSAMEFEPGMVELAAGAQESAEAESAAAEVTESAPEASETNVVVELASEEPKYAPDEIVVEEALVTNESPEVAQA